MSKKVNYGLPFTRSVTIRLNDKQYNHLLGLSKEFDMSISDYLRLYIDLMVNDDMQRGVKYENKQSN